MKIFRMRKLSGPLAAAALMAFSFPAVGAMMAPPSISIDSPVAGATVRGASIPVTVSISNFKLECSNVGKTNAPMGEGHIHIMVDGMDMAQLTNFYCSDRFDISGTGLKPGKHRLAVVLSDDAHMMVGKPAMAMFDYAPQEAKALPQPENNTEPSVRIISPKSGTIVGKKFDIVVAGNSFELS